MFLKLDVGYSMSTATVLGLPAISGISASSGSTNGGQVLTINGNGFSKTTSVVIGSTSCSVTFATINQLMCVTLSRANALNLVYSIR